MFAKVSTFLGPSGFFSTGGTPSLVLSLDAIGYTGSGTWNDLSRFNNDATSDGPISWSSEVDGCFVFDGSSTSFVFATVSGIPLGSTPYTIETWFKSNSYGNGCNITLNISSPVVSSWIDDLNNPGGLAFYLGVGIWNGTTWTQIEKMSLTGTLTTQNIIDYFNGLPNVTCSLNNDTSQLDFVWYKTVACAFTYTLKIAIVTSMNVILSEYGESDPENCACAEQGSLVSWGGLYTPNYSNVLRFNDNGFYNYWWANDIYVDLTGTQSMILDNWYYVVATYDGTYRKLYLNGEQIAVDTPLTPPSVNDMSTLRIGYDGLNHFNGKISKVKIRSKALNSGNILSSFESDKIRHGYVFGGLSFSSASSSCVINDSSEYAFGTNDFTLEVFAKSATFSDYSGIVSLRNNSETGLAINVNQYGQFRFMKEGGYHDGPTMSTGHWYHLAMSRVGGTTSCYINGEFEYEFTDTNNYTNTSLVVGRYYINDPNFCFNGLISNVRLIDGTGLYSGTSSFTPPSTPLTWYTGTKYLLISQKTSPYTDISGEQPSTTANNVEWVDELPVLILVDVEFEYLNFSSTSGLSLLAAASVVSNSIYLTPNTNSLGGNIWRTSSTTFNRNFTLEWNFECSGGDGADGFCVQWRPDNNQTGGIGGDVGLVYNINTIVAFAFRTYNNDSIAYYQNNTEISNMDVTPFTFRQNVYYWMDYDFATLTISIYWNTTNTKPGGSANLTFTSVTFDSGSYYLGFGAGTGGSNDNHILKSMKLTFT